MLAMRASQCRSVPPAAPRRPRRGEGGFTLIEVVVALLITMEVIWAGLALFDFHNKLARVQGQVTDMQQSLRMAQYEMVRMTRIAGRGGMPAVTLANNWGAVAVRNNVGGAVSDQVAIGFSGTPLAVDGTDVLTLRGVFSSSIFSVNTLANPVPLTLNGSPTTATAGTVVVCAYSSTGVAQNLSALISLVTAEQAATQTDALILTSGLADSIYAVVELNPQTSILNANQATCTVPAWVTTAPVPNGIVLGFNINNTTLSDQFQKLSATTNPKGLPPLMTSVAWLGVLEEYRYYLRQDYVVPGNKNSDPTPHLSRARMFPGTETPYQGLASNLQADVADNVMDLQVSLGVDLNGNGTIDEGTPPNTTDEWLGNVAGDTLTPQTPLREVRISTLVKTGNPDFNYSTKTTIGNVEDHTYAATDFMNTAKGREYRRRLIQTVVGLRNL
jgi:Type IV Pilus-assembly protein W/Prokaryotic N-terminal methylation motif